MADIRNALATTTRPLIVAHRGVWQDAPENSLAAIQAARAFDMVEIDVRLSSDGVPFVMHDDSLDRTTEGTGLVAEKEAAHLRQIRLRNSIETIPDLADALEAGGQQLFFDVDVKGAKDLDAVACFLSSHEARHRVMLKADVADKAGLDTLLALQAKHGLTVIAKSVLAKRENTGLLRAMYNAGVAAVEIWFHDLAQVRRVSEIGLNLTTYTLPDVHCNGLSDSRALAAPDQVWGALARSGIRAIMTDEPAAALQFFASFPKATKAS